VPEALHVDWRRRSPNEWLLEHVPWTAMEVALCAAEAGPRSAAALGCPEGAALLALERTTWWGKWSVTFVRFYYPPGHRLWSRG
jgi:GntR family histidine utilization transcriptional repressor